MECLNLQNNNNNNNVYLVVIGWQSCQVECRQHQAVGVTRTVKVMKTAQTLTMKIITRSLTHWLCYRSTSSVVSYCQLRLVIAVKTCHFQWM